MGSAKNIGLVVAIVLIVSSIVYFESLRPMRFTNSGSSEIPVPAIREEAPERESSTVNIPSGTEPKAVLAQTPQPKPTPIVKKSFSRAKEITTPDGFINTDGKPVTISEFVRKKVVLIDFWTYSCINCQRTTPYLNSWYEKYGSTSLTTSSPGLVIIGIHTPEFEFEKIYQNVLDATKRLGIKYPVVLDNDYSTWSAYQNRFWPRKYLIDIDGYVIYDHIGEGGYEETEQKIQEALDERAKVLGEKEMMPTGTVRPSGTESVDASKLRSPEIYFGASRNTYLGVGATGVVGVQTLAAPVSPNANTLYFGGKWDIREEFAENLEAGAKIIFRYQAQRVNLVASADQATQITIIKDGVELKKLTVEDAQLYRVIDDASWGEHTLEIRIEGPGLKAYTLTFG